MRRLGEGERERVFAGVRELGRERQRVAVEAHEDECLPFDFDGDLAPRMMFVAAGIGERELPQLLPHLLHGALHFTAMARACFTSVMPRMAFSSASCISVRIPCFIARWRISSMVARCSMARFRSSVP